MEVTGMSLRWWHRLRQRLRISSCNHGQWIVLQRAENLWCGGWLALEFYRSRKKPDDLWPAWRARVAVCSKCGGTLDEITFACNALGKRTVYSSPRVITTVCSRGAAPSMIGVEGGRSALFVLAFLADNDFCRLLAYAFDKRFCNI